MSLLFSGTSPPPAGWDHVRLTLDASGNECSRVPSQGVLYNFYIHISREGDAYEFYVLQMPECNSRRFDGMVTNITTRDGAKCILYSRRIAPHTPGEALQFAVDWAKLVVNYICTGQRFYLYSGEDEIPPHK